MLKFGCAYVVARNFNIAKGMFLMVYYAYMGIIHVHTELFSDPLSIVFFPNGDLENAS